MNYYSILGVHIDASQKEIKSAYKTLAIKYHPDHNQGDKLSEEKFKIIKKAYEILKNADHRKNHDIELKRTHLKKKKENSSKVYNPFKNNVSEDNFNINEFIQSYEKNHKDKNTLIQKEVFISIEDALKGKNIEIKHEYKSFYFNVPENTKNHDSFYIEHENKVFKIHILIRNSDDIKLKGKDIFVKKYIDFKTMLLGGNINLDIFGTNHTFLLDECTQNGTIITIKEKAFDKGNIYIELNVKMPEKLTSDFKDFISKI